MINRAGTHIFLKQVWEGRDVGSEQVPTTWGVHRRQIFVAEGLHDDAYN